METIGFSAGEAIAAGLILLAASYIRGVTGFGFSAVLVAGLSSFIDPGRAVPLALCFEVVASAVQAPSVWSDIRWRPLAILTAAAVIGNPIGVAILVGAEPDGLRVVVYVALSLMTMGLLRGGSGTIPTTPRLLLFVGLIAGVVNGATALSGLVLVLALSYLDESPLTLRATLVGYFFASNTFVVGFLAANGELESVDGWRVLAGLPILVIGVLLGSKTFRGMQPKVFRRLTIWLLLGLSAVGLLRLVFS